MKAIIIEDKDAKALVDRLSLEKYIVDQRPKYEPDKPQAEQMHRWFHMVVISWLQEQGASVT